MAVTEIILPVESWKYRDYQEPFWRYMWEGGLSRKHAELIWHRRAGKDEVCLNLGAAAMAQDPGTYWHMLPLANQVRKAIWDAVNPHTGKRRITEAFPPELFTYRDTDMLIRAKFNDSTWQCLGSDNYDAAVGSPPRGITYSEWALANPSVRGYLRPIIAENGGWQVFITTPRGKNHAYSTFREAQKNPRQFAQLLTVHDTGMLSPEQLAIELQEYVATYGEAYGIALFEQEYECSFDAAIIGAIWGEEIRAVEKEGRICQVEHNPNFPVYAVFDIGFDDDTAIWIFQMVGGEVRVLECFSSSGKDVDYYISQLSGRHVQINLVKDKIEVDKGQSIAGLEHRKAYDYGAIFLPHDAKAKTLAAKGKSIQEQFAAYFGWGSVSIVPQLSIEDGIQAARKMFRRAYFNNSCEPGIEALRSYHRQWDDEKKMFKDKPEHDWTSHYADSFRYMAVAWKEGKLPQEAEPIRWATDMTFNELLKTVRDERLRSEARD